MLFTYFNFLFTSDTTGIRLSRYSNIGARALSYKSASNAYATVFCTRKAPPAANTNSTDNFILSHTCTPVAHARFKHALSTIHEVRHFATPAATVRGSARCHSVRRWPCGRAATRRRTRETRRRAAARTPAAKRGEMSSR
eukprot:4869295-Pleurochrysis_carterae.AAC.2